jgi:hypothetical protein
MQFFHFFSLDRLAGQPAPWCSNRVRSSFPSLVSRERRPVMAAKPKRSPVSANRSQVLAGEADKTGMLSQHSQRRKRLDETGYGTNSFDPFREALPSNIRD